MFKKVCNSCTNISYSSTKIDRWDCPYCGTNIQYIKAFSVKHIPSISLINIRIKQFRGLKIYKEIG